MIYYLAGDRGLVGRNYKQYLKSKGITTRGGNTDTTNYTHYAQTYSDITKESPRPTHMIINAATVGGLQEDLDRSFELMLRNLKIQNKTPPHIQKFFATSPKSLKKTPPQHFTPSSPPQQLH